MKVSGEGEKIRIAQANGRPMLQWAGKRPLREVRTDMLGEDVLFVEHHP